METIIDPYLLGLINEIHSFFFRYASNLITLGKVIGGLLCLFVVAGEAYQIISLKKDFDILPILRPIAIALVLSFWLPFTMMFDYPFKKLEQWSMMIYEQQLVKVNNLQSKRWDKIGERWEAMSEARAKAALAEKENSDGFLDNAAATAKEMYRFAKDTYATITAVKDTLFMHTLEEIFGFIGNLIWKLAVYATFFIKEVGLGILIVSGPITFGLSVLPMWKDAWSNWLSRYLGLSMYGFVAYLIMSSALIIMQYGIILDTKQLSEPSLLNLGGLGFNFWTGGYLHTIVAYLIGAITIRMTPEIVSWIIPTNSSMGASHFIGGVVGGVKTVATGGGKVVAGSI